MQSKHNDHDASAIPPIGQLLERRPSRWQGMALSWTSMENPTPEFLGRFQTGENNNELEAFLFVSRYELSEALVEGSSLGDGFFVEYFVVTRSPAGGWKLCRLLQQNSITFSESDEANDYLAHKSLRVPAHVSDLLPAWESADEAVWPTSYGDPMTFLGQVRLVENTSSFTSGIWGMTVYLFWSPKGHGVFKVVSQPIGTQTPEEHYASED